MGYIVALLGYVTYICGFFAPYHRHTDIVDVFSCHSRIDRLNYDIFGSRTVVINLHLHRTNNPFGFVETKLAFNGIDASQVISCRSIVAVDQKTFRDRLQ
jgi:hypothetical protein